MSIPNTIDTVAAQLANLQSSVDDLGNALSGISPPAYLHKQFPGGGDGMTVAGQIPFAFDGKLQVIIHNGNTSGVITLQGLTLGYGADGGMDADVLRPGPQPKLNPGETMTVNPGETRFFDFDGVPDTTGVNVLLGVDGAGITHLSYASVLFN